MKRCLNCMEEYQDNFTGCPLCGFEGEQRDLPAFILKEGTFLQGRYIVGTCRSVGACDITYIGWDALFERKVLLQEFYPPELAAREHGTDLAAKEGCDERYAQGLRYFIQYHRSLIRLYQEKDIVEVYSCFIANGTAYATTRYSEAGTLWDWMEKCSGGAQVWESMMFVRKAVLALKKVHAMGLIHGSIGLDSFWVTGDEGLVIKGFAGMDFEGREGTRADLYGLALMAARMLAGQADMKPRRLLLWLKQNKEGLPSRIANALEDCLETNGSGNIQSLDDFYAAIFSEEETVKLGPKAPKAPDSMEAMRRRRRKRQEERRRRRLGIAVCLGAVLLTGCFMMYGRWMRRGNAGPAVEETAGETQTEGTAAEGTASEAATDHGSIGTQENGGGNQ